MDVGGNMSNVRSLWIIFALLAASGSAQENDLRETLLAPLPVRDQFLLNNGFFFFEPESARVLDENQWLIDFHTAEANTFAKSAWISRSLQGQTARVSAAAALALPRYDAEKSLYLVDGETHRATLSVRRGFGSHWELGLAVPLSSIGGGWSDAFIEDVHHLMGIGNAERESLRTNSEAIYFRSAATTYQRQRSTGASIGDVAFTAKYELSSFEDRNLALSLEGALELPTGNARTLSGSGSPDAGIQLLASHDFGRWRVHASVGALLLGANDPLGTKSQVVTTDTIGVSRLLTNRTSVTAQLTVSESPFRHLGMPEFDRRSYQMTAGIQHHFRSIMLYLGFIENVLSYENSADAGLMWGISKRF